MWLALEPHFLLYLAQARSNAAPKGRKRDFADAVRMVKRLLADDLTLSFVPPAEQRHWRLLRRARAQWREQHKRVQNHIEVLLEEGQIKLPSALSDLLGLSGRRILAALAKGESDPATLASLADPHLRATQEELRDALDGHLPPACQLVLRPHLQHLALVEDSEAQAQRALAQLQRLHQEALTRLCAIPGVALDSAQQIIAEVGAQAASSPSAGQLASWVGICPGREESAGVSHNNRSPKGNRALRRLLPQIAWAAARPKGSVFQAQFQRLTARLGTQKAIWAVAHRLLRVIWMVLHKGVDSIELGARLTLRAAAQRKKRLVAVLAKLGFEVTLMPPTSVPRPIAGRMWAEEGAKFLEKGEIVPGHLASASLIAARVTGADPKVLVVVIRGAVAPIWPAEMLGTINVPVLILNGKSDAANNKVAGLLAQIPPARFATCAGDHHSTHYQSTFHHAVIAFLHEQWRQRFAWSSSTP